MSSHPGADITIECICKGDHCTGFSVANNRAYLSDVERDLVGRFTDRDNSSRECSILRELVCIDCWRP